MLRHALTHERIFTLMFMCTHAQIDRPGNVILGHHVGISFNQTWPYGILLMSCHAAFKYYAANKCSPKV